MDKNANVVIINKQHKEQTEAEPLQQNNNSKTEDINIKKQVKIFAILLIAFSVFLFFALLSHTPKDTANIEDGITGIFDFFSDATKLDTTTNIIGVFGAYISDLMINSTIGYWIIGLPICLFIWGWKLNKEGEISDRVVYGTVKYLVVASVFSLIIGSIACFPKMQNIPIEWYGFISAFITSVVSDIISPVGSTIIFSLIFIFCIFKLTPIKKYGLIQSFYKLFNAIKINNILNFIQSLVQNKDKQQQRKVEYTTTTANNNSDYNHSVYETIVPTSNETIINDKPQIIKETEENKDANSNIFDIEHQENIFLNNTEPTSPVIKFTEQKIDKNITNSSEIIDLKGKIQLKIINEPESISPKSINNIIPKDNFENIENLSNNNDTEIENNNDNVSHTMIDDAVFTFNPPVNIELPKQTIIPKEINQNINTEILTNQPIKLDFSKDKIDKNIKPTLTIETDKPEKINEPIKEELSGALISNFRNPLGVNVHEEKINYKPPTIDLLDIGSNENFADDEELQRNGRILQEKLETFNINISNLEVTRGPVITQYEFIPADGVKISKIEGLSDDLAMALKAKSVHIIAPVPEKGTVGIQIPNANPSTVRFRSVVTTPQFTQSNFELPLALGKTVSGEPYIVDLTKMPHLLIAGSTGAGKSVGINTIISSLLYKKLPHQLKFVIVDPKKVELTQYASLSNHFLAVSPDLNTEIITDPQDVITALKAVVLEMEKRYTLLEIAKQRNIKDYNQKVREGTFKNDPTIDHRELPYIVVIIDELADLMLTAGKDVELPIVRLAQMARAVGIHLIIATQRPSVNIITGIIKANFPARIAYLVAQKVDSRTILDASGAEALIGNGDMLFNAANQPKPIRIQNPFISTDEVERICEHIGNQDGYSSPYMLPSTYEQGKQGIFDVSEFDPLFREAAELIIEQQLASTSMLQRRLKIGFARAGRIIDELQSANVIGPPQGSKPRAVLMESISELEKIM